MCLLWGPGARDVTAQPWPGPGAEALSTVPSTVLCHWLLADTPGYQLPPARVTLTPEQRARQLGQRWAGGWSHEINRVVNSLNPV